MNKREREDSYIKTVNIEYDFDLMIKDVATKYKISLALPNISDNDLLQRLLDLKKDKMFFNLNTLIQYRNNYINQKEYLKTLV
jgi:hypothetical protein